MPTKNSDQELNDYLDDALDEFTQPTNPNTVLARESLKSPLEMDSDFVQQLAKNMELLLKQELNGNDESVDIQESVQQLTSVLSDLPCSASTLTNNEPISIQDHVSKTINKLKESDLKVQEEIQQAAGEDDPSIEALMKELEGMMENGDLENVLGGLMDQIMSKELLHEPMKDLATKYPIWIKENASTLSGQEKTRYEKQYGIVSEIVSIYDACPSKEASEEDNKRVVILMEQMQSLGSPPDEIMKELAPGLELGGSSLPSGDCNLM